MSLGLNLDFFSWINEQIIINQVITVIFHLISSYFSFRGSMIDILGLILFHFCDFSMGYLIFWDL